MRWTEVLAIVLACVAGQMIALAFGVYVMKW